MRLAVGVSFSLLAVAHSQPVFPESRFTTVIQDPAFPGISLSFKETNICETTPGVKSYSGYVNLQSTALEDIQGAEPYNVSTFFWFFEARNDPQNAPLAVYLAGGPGEASTYSAVAENGPCYIGQDSNSTYLNPWSFNNHINMLYIDQPVQAGYSYDTLVNGTLNLVNNVITPLDTNTPNTTLVAGTFPSQNSSFTANTTAIGARTLWHFAQFWLSEFPQYHGANDSISFWGNSYGGYYVPGYSAYFQQQNQKIANGTTKGRTIKVDTIGITNGCTDFLVQGPFYPIYAVNNTYDIQTIPESVADEALQNFTAPGGCRDLILQCRQAAAFGDPFELGNNATVNEICLTAEAYCQSYVMDAYDENSGRSVFDISAELPFAFPPLWPVGFFNQEWVQDALGAPLNWTYDSNAVLEGFLSGTGDAVRRSIDDFNQLLQNGVNVAMIFGDRDYQCNWMGAENLTLEAEWAGATAFSVAGYANISTNDSYTGGVVRQVNGMSFSRVFQAGHSVSAWQPETVSRIFDRAMMRKDVATGQVDVPVGTSVVSGYSTSGPVSSLGIREVLPPSPAPLCNIWDISQSCSDAQVAALLNGTAVVQDFVVMSPSS